MQMEKVLHRKSNAASVKFANKGSGITFTICFAELTSQNTRTKLFFSLNRCEHSVLFMFTFNKLNSFKIF